MKKFNKKEWFVYFLIAAGFGLYLTAIVSVYSFLTWPLQALGLAGSLSGAYVSYLLARTARAFFAPPSAEAVDSCCNEPEDGSPEDYAEYRSLQKANDERYPFPVETIVPQGYQFSWTAVEKTNDHPALPPSKAKKKASKKKQTKSTKKKKSTKKTKKRK